MKSVCLCRNNGSEVFGRVRRLLERGQNSYSITRADVGAKPDLDVCICFFFFFFLSDMDPHNGRFSCCPSSKRPKNRRPRKRPPGLNSAAWYLELPLGAAKGIPYATENPGSSAEDRASGKQQVRCAGSLWMRFCFAAEDAG